MNTEIIDPIGQLTMQLMETVGEKGVHQALSQMLGYNETPPTIHEFLFEEDWLGLSLGDRIYPPWRLALSEIFPNPFTSPYSEVIFTGSIGTGKSTISAIGGLYDLIKLSLLSNPHEQFSLLPTKKIAYAIINATMKLAKSVIYDLLTEVMAESPRIRAMNRAAGKASLLPNKIDIFVGSRPSHALGLDIVGAILDEVNFQDKVANQAFDNYNQIKARITSRFFTSGSNSPGRVWMVSSKRSETNFLETHIKDSLQVPTTRVFSFAMWEIHKYKKNVTYCGDKFKVFVGDQFRDPFVLSGKNSSIGLPEERIIDIPVEYKDKFEKNIIVSLRDIAGYSTSSVFKFISSSHLIKKALVLNNPVTCEIVRLDFHDKSDRIIDYIDTTNLITPQHRYNPRFIHIDMALKHDRLAIASSYISDFITSNRLDPVTGLVVTMTEPIFFTEFIIAIEAKSNNEIPIYKIKEFLFYLNREGYPLSEISIDGFQSSQLLQDLNFLGITANLLSVDRTKDPYHILKNAILEGRWMAPKFEILETELTNLIDVGKKIDHPPIKGSKDCSDACAGSVYAAYKAYQKYPSLQELNQLTMDSSGDTLALDW